MDTISLKEYAQAGGEILLRRLRTEFITDMIKFLPFIPAGPAGILLNFLFGWIFDWVYKNAAFQLFCKYTDFRVAHQGNDFGKAITAEILAKRGGNKDEIKKAETEADRLFDNFVIISR